MLLSRHTASSIAAISLALGVADAGRVFAQNAAAETLFSDGERLLREGKTAAACDAFEASNRIEPRAGTLINLGLCREQTGQLASAWSAYKDAIARVKDPNKKKIAEDRVAAIEPRLSYLTVTVAEDSRIDGLVVTRNGRPIDSALWNRAFPVDGGAYELGGRAPGHDDWSAKIEVPQALGKISVEVPRLKDAPKLVAPVSTGLAPAANDRPPSDEGADRQAPGMFTGQRKVAVGVAAVGVVALASGVVLGLQARGMKDDAFALCPDPATPCPDGDRANDLISSGRSRALLANVSYGVGGAALIGAGVLWFLGAPATPERRIAVIPHAGAASAGLDLRVRF